MTRPIINSFLFIIIFCVSTFAQVKVQYKILTGDNSIAEELSNKIEEITYIKNEVKFKESLKNTIGQELKRRGYFNFNFNSIKIEKIDSSLIKCTIDVEEGKQTRINKFVIDGLDKEDSLHIVPIFDEMLDDVFIPEMVEYEINRVLEYYESNGFPFAHVKINSIEWFMENQSPECNVFLNIDKGRYSRIDLIEILGNEKTSDEVIIRELGVPVGGKYSQEIIERIPARLNKLNFFKSVRKPVYYINGEDKGVLQINVEEKQTNNFDGILGYVPSLKENESGYFTGLVNVSLRNLFGTGRAFAVRWETENKFTQEFEIKYLEPWLFTYPVNINMRLFQRKQDSTYIKRTLQTNAEYMLNSSLTTSLVIGVGEIIASKNSGSINMVSNSTSFNLGFNLSIDTRDDLISPTSGLFFNNFYLYIQKKFKSAPTGMSRNNLQKIELDLSFYHRLFSNQVVAASVHGKELRGSLLEDADMFLFGGIKTVRGYREKQFLANRILWSNIEYRFLTEEHSYIFAFFDAGYYLSNQNVLINRSKLEDMIQGYGFGVSLEMGIGLLSVSYAVGKGNSITQGLIHFGIINQF